MNQETSASTLDGEQPDAGAKRLSTGNRRAVSKHKQISSMLRKGIRQGQFPSGHRLQPERELADMFGCSVMTVRQAMDQLIREGLISREQGRGTFVREARPLAAAVVFDFEIFRTSVTSYYPCFVGEIQNQLRSRGWECSYYGSVSEQSSAREFEEAILARRFDGLILSSKWIAAHDLERLRNADVKCVGVCPFPGLDYWVSYDYTDIGWRGAAALAEMGRKRIALVHQPREYVEIGDAAWGFETALLRTDTPFDSSLVRCAELSEESGHRAFLELWALDPRPDGLVVTDELIMKGVLRGMIECGACSPDQLMVASQTSMDDCEYPFPVPVIQLRGSPAEHARLASTMLVNLVEGIHIERPKVLAPPTVYNPFQGVCDVRSQAR